MNAQIKELASFQQNLYELERVHQKLKSQYEEEIIKLRRELEIARSQPNKSVGQAHPTEPPPNLATAGGSRKSVFGPLMTGGNSAYNLIERSFASKWK